LSVTFEIVDRVDDILFQCLYQHLLLPCLLLSKLTARVLRHLAAASFSTQEAILLREAVGSVHGIAQSIINVCLRWQIRLRLAILWYCVVLWAKSSLIYIMV